MVEFNYKTNLIPTFFLPHNSKYGLAEKHSWKFAFHFFIPKIVMLMNSTQVCPKILAVRNMVFCTSFLMDLSKQQSHRSL